MDPRLLLATAPGPSEAHPSPPSYDDAIGRPLHSPSAPPKSQLENTNYNGNNNDNNNNYNNYYNSNNNSNSNLTPRDFDPISGFRDNDDHDLEDERDYEESRPLKMGRIPEARAQYTFIQPNLTTIGGDSTPQGPFSGIKTAFSRKPTYAGVAVGTPSSIAYPPAHNVFFGQNAPSTSTPTVYAPPAFPPPPSLPASSSPNIAAPVPLAGNPDTPRLINSQDISIADYTRTKRGVESCDKVLQDPYQLYRFFVAHNDRPTMHVLITGSHTEVRHSRETDSNGNSKLSSNDVHVEDFRIDLDVTPFISTRGTFYTAPDPKTGKTLTIREAMEQFAEEENAFKEMHMHKREIYKKVKDKTLKSEFQMTISTRDFYYQNYWSIVDHVQYK
ncbi:hypothetical protein BGZ99_007358 [Dissophora globulifera]|uniref:Uncharacterized protein n=1 Tax=Dissophora globulifera TaxID=979702 RepID=A0A9P6UPV3_9FUNG|nr:hypothetical protein BGZ99_007358 [Dissophora globulifera]